MSAPLPHWVDTKMPEFRAIAQVETMASVSTGDQARLEPTAARASHELFTKLRGELHPGLVLFSSGSTGKSKAAVHDLVPPLEQVTDSRHALPPLRSGKHTA